MKLYSNFLLRLMVALNFMFISYLSFLQVRLLRPRPARMPVYTIYLLCGTYFCIFHLDTNKHPLFAANTHTQEHTQTVHNFTLRFKIFYLYASNSFLLNKKRAYISTCPHNVSNNMFKNVSIPFLDYHQRR